MNRTLCATLIDVYHMSLDEIRNLTDFQLKEIYFHERKKSGEIEKKHIDRRNKRKAAEAKAKEELPLESPKDIPVRSLRNPRYKEYFEGFTSLHEMYSRSAITEANFRDTLSKLQAKFADLFPDNKKEEVIFKEEEKDYQTNYNILHAHHMNGILSKEQFEIAIEKLKKQSS